MLLCLVLEIFGIWFSLEYSLEFVNPQFESVSGGVCVCVILIVVPVIIAIIVAQGVCMCVYLRPSVSMFICLN